MWGEKNFGENSVYVAERKAVEKLDLRLKDFRLETFQLEN